MVKEHAGKDIALSLLKMFQEYFICIGLWLGRILISKFIHLFFEFRIIFKVETKLSFIMLLHINSVSEFSEFLKVVPDRPFNLRILICYPDAGYGASGNSRFKLLCSSICNLLICPVRMFTDEFLDGFYELCSLKDLKKVLEYVPSFEGLPFSPTESTTPWAVKGSRFLTCEAHTTSGG